MVADGVIIEPWRPIIPGEAKIPGELSLLPLAMLLAELHDGDVEIAGNDLELCD